jgi:hypothetical protein
LKKGKKRNKIPDYNPDQSKNRDGA